MRFQFAICMNCKMRSVNIGIFIFGFISVSEVVLQSDEDVRPADACGLFEATCPDKLCIAKNRLCDGVNDCFGGSDEINCTRFCGPQEFQCNNKLCIPKLWRCDSNDDCFDNSDEINCDVDEYHYFRCRILNQQYIPQKYLCDGYKDCADASDENYCRHKGITIISPKVVKLQVGETFQAKCYSSWGEPEFVWRLNLEDIPKKCTTINRFGWGKLTCPNIQKEDQGAYSCQEIRFEGAVFAATDTILVVDDCFNGFFNNETRECIPCFCSKLSNKCSNANLYKYHLEPAFDSYEFLVVEKDPHKAVYVIRKFRHEPISDVQLTPVSGGVHARFEAKVLPYIAMPYNYLGNQLKSYGGYLHYRLNFSKYRTTGRIRSALLFPEIILTGNGYTLLYHVANPPDLEEDADVSIELFEGNWLRQHEDGQNSLATREEIMMVLTSVENILIKLQYIDGFLDTTIDEIKMDSGDIYDDFTDSGRTSDVEECSCPEGYSGLSCEDCAPGWHRGNESPLLGECVKLETKIVDSGPPMCEYGKADYYPPIE